MGATIACIVPGIPACNASCADTVRPAHVSVCLRVGLRLRLAANTMEAHSLAVHRSTGVSHYPVCSPALGCSNNRPVSQPGLPVRPARAVQGERHRARELRGTEHLGRSL